MLFKSGILTAASGSFGGLTASHNRFGQYFRARVIPVDPASLSQVEIRTIFGNLAAAWQTLTAAQRDAWDTFAANVPVTNALGDTVFLTGNNMYIRNNAARVQAGLARIDDGPTVFALDSLSPVAVAPVGATDVLAVSFNVLDAWVSEVGAGLLLYGSREKSGTINFFKGPYRFQGIILGDLVLPPTSPDTSITSVFGLTTGNVQFSRLLSVRADGRISPVQFIGPNDIL